MTKPKLILIGAGGHAHACIDVIERQGYFQIAGLIGLPQEMSIQKANYGYSVIGSDSDLFDLTKSYDYALITIGQIQSSQLRMRLFEEATLLGFKFPTIIAPTAHVSRHSTLGAGTIVMHGAIVNAGASIGNNCIINSRALVEHDASVGDHCHISTGAILNGNVTVGAGSFIGSGSIVKQGIFIGKNCLVGMGLSVRKDMTNWTEFTGNDES
jgi:sugar O-acyltransferase (sialic acid O-acetyltransferase NeuD family)